MLQITKSKCPTRLTNRELHFPAFIIRKRPNTPMHLVLDMRGSWLHIVLWCSLDGLPAESDLPTNRFWFCREMTSCRAMCFLFYQDGITRISQADYVTPFFYSTPLLCFQETILSDKCWRSCSRGTRRHRLDCAGAPDHAFEPSNILCFALSVMPTVPIQRQPCWRPNTAHHRRRLT